MFSRPAGPPHHPRSRLLGGAVVALAVMLAACSSDRLSTPSSTSLATTTTPGTSETSAPHGEATTGSGPPAVATVTSVTTESSPAATELVQTTDPARVTTGPAAATAVSLAPAVAASGAVTHGTITVDGRERTYRLYVPTSLPPGPVPLFIGLHGGTGWGDQFAQTDHIEGLAESNGFIVVHPDGVKVAGNPGGVWNGGVCCGIAARDDVDDVGFIAALIDQLATQHDIDQHRVYAFGHSNGAIISERLACELSDRIVAVGLYAGTLGVEPCQPAQPVSVLHVHGDADQNIPIEGGRGTEGISGVDFPSPRAGFTTVAAANGCTGGTTSTNGDLTIDDRSPCAGGVDDVFVTIAGANHAWPGGTPLRTPSYGAAYTGYDATAEIVTFLLSHPRP